MIFEEPSRRPLPTSPDLDEFRYVALKSVASLIPTGGEIFGLLCSPLTQRWNDWLMDLERRLRDLEGKVAGFRFEDLANNQAFVSVTVQATQAALRTHQEDKLEALRNAVMSVAVGTALTDIQHALFLNLIDRFTSLHLHMLKYLMATPRSRTFKPN